MQRELKNSTENQPLDGSQAAGGAALHTQDMMQPNQTLVPAKPDFTLKDCPDGSNSDKNRTPGLKAFDIFLYPFLTNFVVMGISIGATYLTMKGNKRNANGELLYGKLGEWFHKRGGWLENQFMKTGMNRNQASMSKMVFFSFADGTAVAPMVKLLEDRREKIAHGLDVMMGTEPENKCAYDSEPKQSWGSVVGGRLATAMIVVPTAYFLDKKGLNDVLFTQPGERFGKYIAKKPEIAKWFGKLDIPALAKVGTFEAFYTSVCTAGLYFSSRAIARLSGDYDKPGKPYEEAGKPAAPTPNREEAQVENEQQMPENPRHFRDKVGKPSSRPPALLSESALQRLQLQTGSPTAEARL